MIGLFAAAWLSCSYPPETARILQARPPTAAVAMDAPAFWAIVDRTAVHESDPDRQLEALRAELVALTAEEVIAFRNAFEAQLERAYSWDLWAVAYVAHGGASDDGFEYFRRWMVSKGRASFERLLTRPDDLADMLVDEVEGGLEFEEILCVADEVWSEKTGLDPAEMPVDLVSMTAGREPRGVPFEDDPEHLESRIPKTWARFGAHPLG
jgi:hypothetical protein